MTVPDTKQITKINQREQLIHGRQQSGQSVRARCLQSGIRENGYDYWLRIIREEILREAENKIGVLVRVKLEKLAVEAASPRFSSCGIVIRTNGVEAEFPLGTDIGMLAAFVKALSHT